MLQRISRVTAVNSLGCVEELKIGLKISRITTVWRKSGRAIRSRPTHSSQLLHLKEDRKIRGVIQLRFAGFKVPMILFEVRGILMIPVSSLLLQIAALTPARNHSLATRITDI